MFAAFGASPLTLQWTDASPHHHAALDAQTAAAAHAVLAQLAGTASISIQSVTTWCAQD